MRRQLELELLGELALAGPSRGNDLVDAFVDLDGRDVADIVDALSSMAMRGLVAVRNVNGLPFWSITAAGEAERRAP